MHPLRKTCESRWFSPLLVILFIALGAEFSFATDGSAYSSVSQIEIDCETLSGDYYILSTVIRGRHPNDSLDLPVAVSLNEKPIQGTVFQSLVDPFAKRLVLEVVLVDFQTVTSDRILNVMASWMGDSGDPVYARGTLVDATLNHKTGRIAEGPELKLQCQVEGVNRL